MCRIILPSILLISLVTTTQAIVQGSNASLAQFPFIVSIRELAVLEAQHICGGTLIGPRTVLTAARCIDGKSPAEISVLTGTVSRLEGYQAQSVLDIILHPRWNSSNSDNDYGIIHLASHPVSYNPSQAAILPKVSAAQYSGAPLQIAGWGKMSPRITALPNILQSTTMEGTSKEACETSWSSSHTITNSMTCADSIPFGGRRSACDGDFGGPVVASDGFTLVGVMSFGAYDCRANVLPNIASDVYWARDWILSVII